MKLKYILLFVVLSIVYSCHEEEALEPLSTEMSLRFEFPEGDAAWDLDIADIAEKYKTYLIYKNLTTEDFNQAWKGSSGVLTGSPLNEERALFYTTFMKDHVFAFLNPKVTEQVLPVYIYMAYNVYSTTLWGKAPTSDKYDGMDFWCFCLESDSEEIVFPFQPLVRPRTAWDFKLRRGIILKNIIDRIVDKGKIDIPSVFTDDFDYVTEVKYLLGDENDKNYYKKRGFPGQLGGRYDSFGKLLYIKDTSPRKNFIDYMHLAIRYTRDSVAILYPPSEYPKIIQYYDFTVDYLKKDYNWDIAKAAEMPVIENQ